MSQPDRLSLRFEKRPHDSGTSSHVAVTCHGELVLNGDIDVGSRALEYRGPLEQLGKHERRVPGRGAHAEQARPLGGR